MAASSLDPSAGKGRSDVCAGVDARDESGPLLHIEHTILPTAGLISPFRPAHTCPQEVERLSQEALQRACCVNELGSRDVRIAEYEALESGREVVAEDSCSLLGCRRPGHGRRILRKPVCEDLGLLLVHHQPKRRHHCLENGGGIATLGLTVLLQNLELSLELVERHRKEVGYVCVASHQPERPPLANPTDQDSGTALLDR